MDYLATLPCSDELLLLNLEKYEYQVLKFLEMEC